MKNSAISAADAAICEQHAIIPGSPFQVSFHFTPQELASRLLALRAFFALARSVSATVSEPSLALVKLSWWQKELRDENVQGTQHPVVRAMRDSGVLACVDTGLLGDYISSVAEFAQTETYEDEAALRRLAEAIGGREARLEVGQGGDSGHLEAATNIGAGSFIYRAVLTPGIRKCMDSWWVPSTLQARHGVNAHSVEGDKDNERWLGLRTTLCSVAKEWLECGIMMCGESIPIENHHLVINARVKLRRLDRILANPGKTPGLSMDTSVIGDVLAAWRTARKLRVGVKGVPPPAQG